jgi:RTX calcium-binding nonapeptide repeat (4 copies)
LGRAVIRQGHLMAVGIYFLMGCVVLLMVVGCTGGRSVASHEEQQGRTEATKQEQTRSPEATASEETRCKKTRPIDLLGSGGAIPDMSVKPGDPEALYVTNDLPGCPKGGLLTGTSRPDQLAGEDGEDEVRGLGSSDILTGGLGRDVLYGGPSDDELYGGGKQPLSFYIDKSKNVLHGGPGKDTLSGDEGDDVIYGGDGNDFDLWGSRGEDVIYGGDGNDHLDATTWDRQRDKLYCGAGRDEYTADKLDYVSSSCEIKLDGSY